MRERLRRSAALFLWIFYTTTAAADPARPELTPPRLLADAAAVYPAEAAQAGVREVTHVTVILDIDATGAVSGVKVETPRGNGFDEAAVEAARRLVFEPARRGGSPIASRISFRFSFEPPARAAEPAPPPGAPAAAAGAPAAAAGAPAEAGGQPPQAGSSEIVVQADRPPREVTRRSLSREEIAQMPGTNGDGLRAVQNLPGVARPPPFSGQLVVRGSAPQDTTIFIEGVDVPLVYHFGGLSSVVPTDLLERIDFFPANYGAVYGRGTGGMVDVRLRSPRADGIHGMAQVDFIDARLLAEGPIGDSGLRFLVAARRSYFDLWLGSLLESAAGPVTTAPRYYDYQLMLEKDIGARSSLRLSLLGSDDALQILNQSPSASTPTFAGSIGMHTSFWRAQLRFESRLSEHTRLRAMGSFGQDSIDFGFGPNFFTVDQKPVNARVELSQRVARGVLANIGADVVVAPYDITLRLPPPRRPGETYGGPLDVPQQTHAIGSRTLPALYSEWELLPWAGARLVPSVRADYTSTTRSWDIAPRVSVRQDLNREFPRSTLKGGAGLFFQPPTPVDADPTYGQRGLVNSRAAHYDLGFEQEFTPHLRATADVFYKALDRLVVPGRGNAGTGRVYGAEWMLKYSSDGRFFGWLAYSLSRSERRDEPSSARRLFEFDQTHVLTLVGSYSLGRGWRLGARFRFVSGNLFTPEHQGAFDATSGIHQSASDIPRFAERLPPFHQLDVRVDKTWTIDRWKLSFYADVQNLYYRQNPEGVSYSYDYTRSTHVNGLPILPSLGLRGER